MAGSPVQAGSLVGERLGKYDLLALLAIGGTAEIYLARIGGEAGFEKYVVVKCLLDHLADDAEFVRMFLDEARLGAQLDHSNIVQTLELGQHQGRYYMVMEYLAGMSLAQLGRKASERMPGGLMPCDIVLGLAAQASAGLHYAHRRSTADGTQLNIVHRDVSPQNLVVTFEGVLKIVDFGIAKAELRQTHTRSGTIKGKFAYMSPEQCLAEPLDRRTDVFALGTVVHELLSARRLFKRVNTYETYQAILKGNVPPPSRFNPEVDPELDQVVLRALTYQKEDRHESAEVFGEALLAWLHRRGKSVSASDVSRFLENVCAQELEEHGQHMRELIEGRPPTHTDLLLWDGGADPAENSASALGGISDRGTYDFDDSDPSSVSGAGFGDHLGRAGAAADDDDDDGEFGGDTRIDRHGDSGVGAGDSAPDMPGAGAMGAGPADFRVPGPAPLRGGGARPEGDPRSAPGTAGPGQPTLLRPQTSDPADRRTQLEADHGVSAAALPGPASAPGAPPAAPHHPGEGLPPRVPGSLTPHPLAVYDTPAPVAPLWLEDSSSVLRHRGQPGTGQAVRPGPVGAPRARRPGERPPVPPWILALAFLVSAGVGLVLTVLIGKLVA